MCFTQQQTLMLAVLGTVAGVAALVFPWKDPRHKWRSGLPLFFSLMEWIQYAQYSVASPSLADTDACAAWGNVFWTFAGWAHVAFQPFATHYIAHRMDGGGWRIPPHLQLLLVGGCVDVASSLFPGSWWGPRSGGSLMTAEGYDWDGDAVSGTGGCGGDLWVASNRWCTFTGHTHLAWAVPLPRPSYFRNGHMHAFLMFAPYVYAKTAAWRLSGLVLFLTGPVLSEYLVQHDRYQSASVWCLFSVFQTTVSVLVPALAQLLCPRAAVLSGTTHGGGKPRRRGLDAGSSASADGSGAGGRAGTSGVPQTAARRLDGGPVPTPADGRGQANVAMSATSASAPAPGLRSRPRSSRARQQQ